MKKSCMSTSGLVSGIALCLLSAPAAAGQPDKVVTPQSWSGVVINSICTVDEAFAESEKCTGEAPGAKLSLYDDTLRHVYNLDPQDAAIGHLGESVTVRGTLVADTIHVIALKPHTAIGLAVGQKAPAFLARDQFGREQSLEGLKGPMGTVLLFFRSADWWPYCKGQLVELQNARTRFEQQGLSVAAISYDSVEILKVFADRRKITFPLLADPQSVAIRAYDVLNTEATGQFHGMARPGYFFIDPRGIIREKFFEAKYRERISGNTVIGQLFPALRDEVTDRLEAPHLTVSLAQADRTTVPGGRIRLTAEVELPSDVHVYAPTVQGYKPIALIMNLTPDVAFTPVQYPRSKMLYLPAIKERVPVLEGKFRLTQDVTVSSAAAFSNALGADGKTVTIAGRLEYQACDRTICYLPTSVPVRWQLHVVPLDRQRAPEAIQHR